MLVTGYPKRYRLYDHTKVVATLTAWRLEDERDIEQQVTRAILHCKHDKPGLCLRVEEIEQ